LLACCTTDSDSGGTSRRQNVPGLPSSTWTITARMTAESAMTRARPVPGAWAAVQPATRARSAVSDSPPLGAASGSVRQARNPSGSCSATRATACPDHSPADQARNSSQGEATSPSAVAVSAARRSGARQTALSGPTRATNRPAKIGLMASMPSSAGNRKRRCAAVGACARRDTRSMTEPGSVRFEQPPPSMISCAPMFAGMIPKEHTCHA
jgi:hypothetical protein